MNKRIVISGLLLNLSFFIPALPAQLLTLFVLSIAFLGALKAKTFREAYLAGLLFFGAWLLPATYWYYLIFPWPQAFLQSFGWATLMALVFTLPFFLKKYPVPVRLAAMVMVWTLITSLRIYLPWTAGWWIPDLYSTQWLNPSVTIVARIAGVPMALAVILIVNAFLACLLAKRKTKSFLVSVILIVFICVSGNIILKTISNESLPFTVIALQKGLRDGIRSDAIHQDVLDLEAMTRKALSEGDKEATLVIWPENMISPKEDEALRNFAAEQGIHLIYNRAEPDPKSGLRFNTAIIIDPGGKTVLTNSKKHAAPLEKIVTRDNSGSFGLSTGAKTYRISPQICYDLHYPDINSRLRGNDLILGLIDDDAYGRFLPYLHAADIVFRAVESNASVITASTSGPTFYVNRWGVVKIMPLPIYDEGILKILAKK